MSADLIEGLMSVSLIGFSPEWEDGTCQRFGGLLGGYGARSLQGGQSPSPMPKARHFSNVAGFCGSLLRVDVFCCLVSLGWTGLRWSQTCSVWSFLPGPCTAFLGSVVLGDRGGSGASVALCHASRFEAGAEQGVGKQARVQTAGL